jgi:hypothetical protein
MAVARPLRFFVPPPKRDKCVQAALSSAVQAPFEEVTDRMRTAAIAAILSCDPRPSNRIELAYALGYRSQVGFLRSTAPDDRFDLLTPPAALFADLPAGFRLSLHGEAMELSAADRSRAVAWPYDAAAMRVIEGIEAGVANSDLIVILRTHLNADGWENGYIVCQITDCRPPQPLEGRRLLRAAVATLYLGNSLEWERRVIASQWPAVCVDPSPDVARVQSAADWRRKAWSRPRPLEGGAMAVRSAPAPPRKEAQEVTIVPLTEVIAIPMEITKALAEDG